MKNFEFKKPGVFICILLTAVLLTCCKSTQRFSGNAELTIFVIDENDSPVKNVEVHLKSGAVSEAALTNQNGLCVFHDITSGEYSVFSSKEGFANSQVQICFVERTEVFCIKVFSSEYIFEQVENLYERSSYEQAIELLEKIDTGKNQMLQNVKSFYISYGFAKLEKKKEAKDELNKIKAEPPFDDSAQKYKIAIQKMLE